jgi:hypothetical protein
VTVLLSALLECQRPPDPHALLTNRPFCDILWSPRFVDIRGQGDAVTSPQVPLPAINAVLTVSFWEEPLRVIMTSHSGNAVSIQPAGVHSGQYRDVTLTAEQLGKVATIVAGNAYCFDADPALFGLAAEAIRTNLAHTFVPEFAISAKRVGRGSRSPIVFAGTRSMT